VNRKLQPRIHLTERFFEAVRYATELHRDQVRKSTDIPYICHPLGAASLVIEAGGDEDQVIGALLHDIAEDCGGEPRLVEIRALFGDRVERIVRGCSDSLTETEDQKASWSKRKEAHISHLKEADHDVLLVTAADKVHNARAIATDLQTVGEEVWKRFDRETSKDLIIGYYNQIYNILLQREVTPTLLNPLKSAIAIMSGGAR
jgi:(p)ppGpp synthase/HD superfamily hydrolase